MSIPELEAQPMAEEITPKEVATRVATAVIGPMPLLTNDEISRTWRVASALAASGMFKDARQAEQAFAKILLGRDLGLSPTQAMTGIHIVEGKPEIAAVTLASFVQRLPDYDYRIREHDEQHCKIEFFYDEESLGFSEFTMAHAQQAGLVKDRSPWVKHPRNMLFARAMSNGVKWLVPEATGGIPVYHEGEVQPVATLTEGEPTMQVTEWGEDEQLANDLRRATEILGWTNAKVRLELNGCADHEARVALLATLQGEIDSRSDPEPTDAEVIEPSA